ncbi:MAG: hypothetical protein EOP92_05635 [Lysobacteraceae bacterium]|nr:MAG: hypothetical protein EOP92_05635 [Xanthomonadaceae bacterium]
MLSILLLLLRRSTDPLRRGEQDRSNPEGAAHRMCGVSGRHMDVPSGNSGPARESGGFIAGRDVGRLSFGYFSLPFKEK